MTQTQNVNTLIQALNASDPVLSEDARSALIAQGIDILPMLLAHLPTLNPKQSLKVASILGALGHPDCQVALLQLLEHPHPLVKVAVVQALAHYPSHTVFEALLPLLQSPDMMLQIAAVTSLGKLGDQRAVAPLAHLLQQTNDSTLRYNCIRALGNLGDASVLPLIASFANDPNHHVRDDVAQAMGKLV